MAKDIMNITDYTKAATQTFEEKPFNIVDSLVLCQLFYSRLEAMTNAMLIDGKEMNLTVKDFYRNEYFDKMFMDDISDDENLELYSFAAASRRFRDIKLKNLVVEFDEEEEKQFAAVTFVLDNLVDYVAFRGTDGTLLGWKEDFNMAFLNEIPSQTRAAEYICDFYGSSNKRIYVGGHSKGGNLAAYAAAMCGKKVQGKIIEAFSHDGPGFRDETLDRPEFRNLQIKINKTVPQTSIIGMLLEAQEDYTIVKSNAIGIMQHSAFTWQVKDDDFIYTKKISRSGSHIDQTMHDWVMSASDKDREIFVDTLFKVLEDNNIKTLHDMRHLSPRTLFRIISTVDELNEEKKTIFLSMFKSLISIAVKGTPDDEDKDSGAPILL